MVFLVVFLKNLSKTENFFSVIFYFQLFLFIFIGLIFYNKIELPNLNTLIWIILMSILGNLSQIFYFQALKFKDVSFVTPFEYLRFIIIAFFGVVLFSEEPNISTYIGSIIIFIGLILISVDSKIFTKGLILCLRTKFNENYILIMNDQILMTFKKEEWPLKESFKTSNRSLDLEVAETILVELKINGIVGRGESTPFLRYGESVENSIYQLSKIKPLVEKGITREELQNIMPPNSARCAVGCALWDYEAKK